MRSKILENQVRSCQLSSGQFLVVGGTSRPLVWKGRGTKRYSRMCPPLKRSFATFDRGGQTGPPRSNAFFSAPLTTCAPPTTVRPDVRPNARPNVRPNFWVFGTVIGTLRSAGNVQNFLVQKFCMYKNMCTYKNCCTYKKQI